CCGHRVITGNHDCTNTHPAQFREAFTDTAFDDVLQVYDTKKLTILCDGKRCAARLGDRISDGSQFGKRSLINAAALLYIGKHRIHRTFANDRTFNIYPAHAALRGERYKMSVKALHVAPTQAVFFLGKNDDRATFRCLIGKRSQLCRVGQVLRGYAADRYKSSRLTIAEGD